MRGVPGVLAAEWLKATSVRSTRLVLGLALGAVLLGAALAWAAAGAHDSATVQQQARAQLARLEEVVLIVPQLCLGVLGVLSMAGEHATGSIRTSLAAVPRRRPLLAAKSAVATGLGLLVGPLVVFGTHAAARSVVGDRFGGEYTAPFIEDLPLLATSSATVAVFAALGVGLGAVLRSTAAAVACLVAISYVVPVVAGSLPEPWSERVGSVLPGALPRAIVGADRTGSVYGSLLPPAAATALLAAHAVVPLLAAWWAIHRRDV